MTLRGGSGKEAPPSSIGAREKALADALQLVLDDWANSNTILEDAQDKAHRALNMPSSGWIPVSERLPEGHDHRIGNLAYNAGGVFYTTVHPSWWNHIDKRGSDHNGPTVTHWMPIPKGPQ